MQYCHFNECMQVQQEDIALCEAVQRGLRSPAYDSGRCAPAIASDLDSSSLHLTLCAAITGVKG